MREQGGGEGRWGKGGGRGVGWVFPSAAPPSSPTSLLTTSPSPAFTSVRCQIVHTGRYRLSWFGGLHFLRRVARRARFLFSVHCVTFLLSNFLHCCIK